MDWDDFQKLPTCAVGGRSGHTAQSAGPEKRKPTCVPVRQYHEVHRELQPERQGGSGQTGAKSPRATGTKAKPKVTRYDDGTYRVPEQGLPGAVPAGGQPREGVHVS